MIAKLMFVLLAAFTVFLNLSADQGKLPSILEAYFRSSGRLTNLINVMKTSSLIEEKLSDTLAWRDIM